MKQTTFANLIFTQRIFFIYFFLSGDCLVRTCLVHYLLGLETLLTYNLCKYMLIFIEIFHVRVFLWMLVRFNTSGSLFVLTNSVLSQTSTSHGLMLMLHSLCTHTGCFKIMTFLVGFLLQQEAWKSFRHLIFPIIHLVARYQVPWEASRT